MKLAKAAVVVFLVEIALVAALAAVVAAIPFGGSFGMVESDALPHQRMLVRLFAMQPLVIRLWWLRLPLHAAAVVLFIAWLYRTHRSLKGTSMKSHWAITGWIVPLYNFVAPYLVARDVWRAASKERGRVENPSHIITVWWAVVVIGALAFLVAIPLAAAGIIRARPMELNWLAIADYTLEIVLAALFIAVLAAVEEHVHGAPLFVFGRTPLLPSAAAASAAIALVMTAGVFGFYQMRGRWAREVLSGGGVALEDVAAMEPPPQMMAAIAPPPPPIEPVEHVGARSSAPGTPEGVVGGVAGGIVEDPPPPKRMGAPPPVLHRVMPVYPDIARQARMSGVVILECTVDTSGKVTNVRVIRALPLGLDRAAVEAVKQWRFEPPAEPVTFPLTVNFKLPERRDP